MAKDLKERFVARTFQQYKTLKSAFVSWKEGQKNHITYERFHELINLWSFVVTDEQILGLFNWLDSDQDGVITFEDLRSSIGKDISPNEGIYFRQDIKNGKDFQQSWENNLYWTFFSSLSQSIKREQWEDISTELMPSRYIVSLGKLSSVLKDKANYQLTHQHKQFIFKTYKVSKNIEDDSNNIDDRMVNVKELITSKMTK